MRSVCGVLTALVLSGTISIASAETMTAEEKADVAITEEEIRAVEEEIRIVNEAIAIHNRARERARKAVEMSSLGRKLQQVEREWEKFKRGEETKDPASRIRDERIMYKEKIDMFVKRMTRIFLKDEVAKAARKKLPRLKRELEKISRQYAEI